MRAIVALSTIAFLAPFAFAQQDATVDRVLHFTSADSPQTFEEIGAVIHSITDVGQAKVDPAEKSLSLRGTASQIALAEWLFTNLDRSTGNQARHEYRVLGNADDVVRLFYLTNPEVPEGVQEMVTAVRSIGEIWPMFTYNDLRAVAVRGTAEQMRLAEFLFAEMDKPAVAGGSSEKVQSTASPEFRMSEPQENVGAGVLSAEYKVDQEFPGGCNVGPLHYRRAPHVHLQSRTRRRHAGY